MGKVIWEGVLAIEMVGKKEEWSDTGKGWFVEWG